MYVMKHSRRTRRELEVQLPVKRKEKRPIWYFTEDGVNVPKISAVLSNHWRGPMMSTFLGEGCTGNPADLTRWSSLTSEVSSKVQSGENDYMGLFRMDVISCIAR
jgi:hypothetical protein